nr:ryanodine receptor-like [Dermacentor andersoni]
MQLEEPGEDDIDIGAVIRNFYCSLVELIGRCAPRQPRSPRMGNTESDMALALNRYIGNSVLPMLIQYHCYFTNAGNYASLLDETFHTVYRLSKVKILTEGQTSSSCLPGKSSQACFCAFCGNSRWMSQSSRSTLLSPSRC